MIVYESTKGEFIDSVINDTIADKIYTSYQEKIGRTSINEQRSWQNSMQYMFKVLHTSNIPDDSGVAIEFQIPSTSKRVDFILSGKTESNNDSVVIIELKQWEKVNKVEGKDGIVKTYVGGANREVIHPSYQAWSYAAYIEDYNESVQVDNISLYPCAYLHNLDKNNYNNEYLEDEMYEYHINKAPIFSKGEVIKLREFISTYIKYGDNKENLYKIENGKIRPSKSLQDTLSSMLKGNQEFIMLDKQKVVYETALDLARKSYRDSKKRVLIVDGGPGTGKSVLAINLLVNLTSEDLVCQYITKNAAPRSIYSTKLKGDFRKTHIDNLFKGSGSYIYALNNEFDALIVDEAHRLNEKSGLYKNKGENQIKEVTNASKFSVFFIDEHQRIDINDIGSIKTIEKFADLYNAEVTKLELESQFRCNGSDGYISWLEDLLEIRETANYDGFDGDFDFRVIDNPNDLKHHIFEKNEDRNKARLLAGYCWNWIKDGKNNTNTHDIVIDEYNFSMSWNLGNSTTWAIDPKSVNEIGCIHTSQGLEFDYVGVIIGKDLRFENGAIVTDFFERAKTDQSLKGIKKLYKNNPDKALETADEIIKNTYRTLLSRGMKGCYIYCCDEGLSSYFKKKLSQFDS